MVSIVPWEIFLAGLLCLPSFGSQLNLEVKHMLPFSGSQSSRVQQDEEFNPCDSSDTFFRVGGCPFPLAEEAVDLLI